MKRFLTFIALIMLFLPLPTLADAIDQNIVLSSNTTVRQFHQESRSSAVKVVTQRGHGSGSYIKIGRNFYVLTARHVVDAQNIVVIQAGAEAVIGEVVFKSESQDIALIKIPALRNKEPSRIKQINNELQIGDELVYSGFPSGYDLLTSGGSISGKEGIRYILQGFAWPGSSGSGAIDRSGRIRGVIVAIGVDFVAGNPQLIETIVWMEPITNTTWREIQAALEL